MHLRDWGGTVIFGVLLGLGGLLHSHAVAAIALSAVGVLAGFAVCYDIGQERGKKIDDLAVVLSGVEGAVFGQRTGDYMVLWLQLRARNHRQATVLTDWNATLTIGESTLKGTHSTNELFLPEMKNQIALDQATASTPLHGEITGWVSFGVEISNVAAVERIVAGEPASVVVSVQDSHGKISETEIDLSRLWNDLNANIKHN